MSNSGRAFSGDISDREHAEEALRKSEEQLRGIAQNVPGIVYQFSLDKNGEINVNYMSDSTMQYLGIDNHDPEIIQRFMERIAADDLPDYISSREKAIKNITKWEWQGKYICPDGKEKYFHGLAQPRLLNDEIVFDGLMLDITESKLAEKELADTKALLSAAIMQTPIPMVIVSAPDYVIRMANNASREILGIADEPDYTGTSFFELKPTWQDFDENGNQIPLTELPIAMALQGIDTKNKELRVKRKDGTIRWESVSSTTVRNSKGDTIAAYLIFPDITERRLAEEALRKSGEQYKIITNTSLDGFAIADSKGNLLDVNDAYCRMTGYSRDELLRMSVADIEIIDSADYIPIRIKKSIPESQRWETRHRCKDGSIIDVEVSMTFMLQSDQVFVFIRDITELRRMNEALRKRIVALTRPLDRSEEINFEDLFNLPDVQRLQDLYADAFGVAALITYPDGTPITKPSNFTYLCREIIRNTAKGIKRCNYSDSIIGRGNPSGPTIRTCLSAGLCNAGVSITVGGRHIANWLIGQVRDGSQNEEEIIKYAHEIGADENAFREAYREVPVMPKEQFDKAAGVIFTLARLLSTLTYQNVQQARFIADRRLAEEELAKHREHLEELVRERTRELEAAQEELIGKERLAVLGQLTATVSHELRNPLGVIRSSAFYLREKIKGCDDKIAKHLNRIESQVDLCNSIVEELLEYTKGSGSEMMEGDIVSLLEKVLEEIQGAEGITVNRIFPAGTPMIIFDYGKISRVITNLLNNSIYSVREKAEKGNAGIPYKPEILVSASQSGDGIEIIIEDTGTGMDEKTTGRAFEPLFTTKARGVGLGLAIVKKIMEEHGGKVKIESELNRGTRVKLWLPCK